MNPQNLPDPATTLPESGSANPQPVPPPAAPAPETCHLQPEPSNADTPSRRRQGKIPSLPKAQRDTINALLNDGATYARVIQHMAAEGVSLNGENLSNWYQTGFQDYLAELQRLDYQRARYESASALLQDTDTAKLPEAGLQTAAAQLYDLLGRFTPAALAQNMAGDPDKYTRLLNALFRLSRETLALQKNRQAHSHTRATASQPKDMKRKLSDSERRAIVLEVDDILGVNSHAPPQSPDTDQDPHDGSEASTAT